MTRRFVMAGGVVSLVILGGASFVASQPPSPGPRPSLPGFATAEGPLPDRLNQAGPRLGLDRGTVYRLWTDEWAGRGHHIRFQRSTDGGGTWPAESVLLDRDEPLGALSSGPAFAQDGTGRVMAIWRTAYPGAGGRRAIRFLASPDRGATWPGPTVTLSRGGGAFSGEISADGRGRVYVVWYEERVPGTSRPGPRSARGAQVAFTRSEDSGQSWLPDPVLLSAGDPGDSPDAAGSGARRRGPAYLSFQPRVASDAQGRVFVCWLDTRRGSAELFARVSEDHGGHWGPGVNVSRGARNARDHQVLTDGAGRVFVVWSDGRDGPEDVFFARSEDAGKTWEEPRRLSQRPAGATTSAQPHMALGPGGRLYVAWADRRNGREDVYLNLSTDAGKTWLDRDVRLDRDDEGTAVSRAPFVVASGTDGVAVLWQDDRTGFEQILLTRSDDGGRTWHPAEVRVDTTTAAGARAQSPSAVWDPSGALHVVWEVWAGGVAAAERRLGSARLPLNRLGHP
ncbi:MAG: sialidase family protein [Candidatus Rokuibacteriota bacterium]